MRRWSKLFERKSYILHFVLRFLIRFYKELNLSSAALRVVNKYVNMYT